MMVYVNFHKSSSPREFAGGRGGRRNCLAGAYHLSPNFSETTWNFQTQLTKMIEGSMRMLYINFHSTSTSYSRDFSVIAEIWGPVEAYIHSENFTRKKRDNKTMTILWIKVSVQDFEGGGQGRGVEEEVEEEKEGGRCKGKNLTSSVNPI